MAVKAKVRERGWRAYPHEVRGILDGLQIQFRRPVRLLPDARYPDGYDTSRITKFVQSSKDKNLWVPIIPAGQWPMPKVCRYGVPGTYLWIKEDFWHEKVLVRPQHKSGRTQDHTGANEPEWEHAQPEMFAQRRASAHIEGLRSVLDGHIRYATMDRKLSQGKKKWTRRRASEMPRWASRILLRVVNIRIERVQKITSHDVVAEGIRWDVHEAGAPVRMFRNLWDSVNDKKHRWLLNPFVWVVSFKRTGCKI